MGVEHSKRNLATQQSRASERSAADLLLAWCRGAVYSSSSSYAKCDHPDCEKRTIVNMGFRQGAVLASCSFFLGVLFICFFVDYRILYQPLTDVIVEDGFQFYTTFFNAPPAIKALLHAFIGVGILGLVAKLNVWDESAILFDGSSLAAYIFAVAVYVAVTIPSLRTIVHPAEVDSREDRVEAMRILAAGNTIMMVVLATILILQSGQAYAARVESNELAKADGAEKEKVGSVDEKDKQE